MSKSWCQQVCLLLFFALNTSSRLFAIDMALFSLDAMLRMFCGCPSWEFTFFSWMATCNRVTETDVKLIERNSLVRHYERWFTYEEVLVVLVISTDFQVADDIDMSPVAMVMTTQASVLSLIKGQTAVDAHQSIDECCMSTTKRIERLNRQTILSHQDRLLCLAKDEDKV